MQIVKGDGLTLAGSVVLAEGLVVFITRTVAVGGRRMQHGIESFGKRNFGWTDGCRLSPEGGDSSGKIRIKNFEDLNLIGPSDLCAWKL
jgi:hypothetical protein